MTAPSPADRDADAAAVVVAIVAALVTTQRAEAASPEPDGWGRPVLRDPLPAASAGAWWRSGGPR